MVCQSVDLLSLPQHMVHVLFGPFFQLSTLCFTGTRAWSARRDCMRHFNLLLGHSVRTLPPETYAVVFFWRGLISLCSYSFDFSELFSYAATVFFFLPELIMHKYSVEGYLCSSELSKHIERTSVFLVPLRLTSSDFVSRPLFISRSSRRRVCGEGGEEHREVGVGVAVSWEGVHSQFCAKSAPLPLASQKQATFFRRRLTSLHARLSLALCTVMVRLRGVTVALACL